MRTRAQASPSRSIAQIRSGIVRGSLRLPTQIVEEPEGNDRSATAEDTPGQSARRRDLVRQLKDDRVDAELRQDGG